VFPGKCQCGGIGRRGGFKIRRSYQNFL